MKDKESLETRLRDASKALQEIDDALEVESNQRLVEFILGHPEVIDVFAPEHAATDCDDWNVVNVGPCSRCSLLSVQRQKYVDDFTWEFRTKSSR